MTPDPIHLDAVIFGGGVAGLWLLDDLRRAGYRAVLLEASALGDGQTVASQGIIHGGFKYSLKGMVNASARAISDMPLLWREALAGDREPDLSDTIVRGQYCHMWVSQGAPGRTTMAATKLVLRVKPESLPESDWPAALRKAKAVYRIDEQVVDPVSLVGAFQKRNADHILKIDPRDGLLFDTDEQNNVTQIRLTDPDAGSLTLAPRHVVLTAGSGNADLRDRLNLPGKAMQRRPLHMVMARGVLPDINGHCIDRFKTRMTITTVPRGQGLPSVWQIGGQLAEDGVDRDPAELLEHAAAEVTDALPGVPLRRTQWATYRIDRAESANEGKRPDTASHAIDGNVITAFPTKLALAPALARDIAGRLPEPDASIPPDEPMAHWKNWPRPDVADPPWDQPQDWVSFNSIAPVADLDE